MVTEHPEDAKAWAAGHAHWSAFASGLYESVRDAFHALTRIQFDAPWQREQAPAEACRAPCRHG